MRHVYVVKLFESEIVDLAFEREEDAYEYIKCINDQCLDDPADLIVREIPYVRADREEAE